MIDELDGALLVEDSCYFSRGLDQFILIILDNTDAFWTCAYFNSFCVSLSLFLDLLDEESVGICWMLNPLKIKHLLLP